MYKQNIKEQDVDVIIAFNVHIVLFSFTADSTTKISTDRH